MNRLSQVLSRFLVDGLFDNVVRNFGESERPFSGRDLHVGVESLPVVTRHPFQLNGTSLLQIFLLWLSQRNPFNRLRDV